MNEANLIELLSNESEKFSDGFSNFFQVVDTGLSAWKETTSNYFAPTKQTLEPVKIRFRKGKIRRSSTFHSSSIQSSSNLSSTNPSRSPSPKSKKRQVLRKLKSDSKYLTDFFSIGQPIRLIPMAPEILKVCGKDNE